MRRLTLLAVPLLLLPAFAAQAQLDSRPRGPMTPQQGPSTDRPPPAALPGLANRPASEPIPSDTPSANMPPNAALFDAINRGDMAAAREAMSRGADLEARNALGLAPVDAAVDQGRNDIAFYLLSARAASRTVGEPEDAFAPPPPAPRNARQAGGRPSRGAERPQREAAERPVREAPAARTRATREAASAPNRGLERASSADGGTPRPDAGFLGFNGGRGG
ncbi:hypothetical protein [Roseomonas sp. BN140053]|uniref:hypothetical protein n=1 Tax=Roseomonas sp. BN140053 TaxID=3391898 RepID=UPI0039ED7814